VQSESRRTLRQRQMTNGRSSKQRRYRTRAKNKTPVPNSGKPPGNSSSCARGVMRTAAISIPGGSCASASADVVPIYVFLDTRYIPAEDAMFFPIPYPIYDI
jgi:hypothetical protein